MIEIHMRKSSDSATTLCCGLGLELKRPQQHTDEGLALKARNAILLHASKKQLLAIRFCLPTCLYGKLKNVWNFRGSKS